MPMSFGPNDPNSLPAMLGRMTPGMTPGPVPTQQLTPGFRPPGAGGAPGMAAQPQVPGMGMDPSSMAALMGMLGGQDERTSGDRDMNGYGGNPSMTPGQDASGNPIMLPNPNAPDQSGMFGWLKSAMKGLF